ncbi:MAG: hypothetical protein FWD15_01455 [Alphaproteobacteria bacterium]|nr:hypothetical protein [Alphaproteobacteria bacterium]
MKITVSTPKKETITGNTTSQKVEALKDYIKRLTVNNISNEHSEKVADIILMEYENGVGLIIKGGSWCLAAQDRGDCGAPGASCLNYCSFRYMQESSAEIKKAFELQRS